MSTSALGRFVEDRSNSWQEIVARYHTPDLKRAWRQILNTFVPYAALWVLMILSLQVSYVLTLGISVIAAGLLIRVFIIFHDCGHGSFFQSRRANDTLGFIAGMLTFTPYHYWRHRHAMHHATAGNLDRRGVGDIWTMTRAEYESASRWQRIRYRCSRNPFVMFIIGPMYLVLFLNRFAVPSDGWRWHRSVLWSNLAIAAVAVAFSLTIGFKAYVMIQLPVLLISASLGIWLFYVQHQFEGVYWARQTSWDYLEVALRGSSYYRLPRVLQWISGNIGFHHIHHLSPRIPNYLLEKCHRENAIFQRVKGLHLRESFKSLRYRVWDEEAQKLVPIGPFFL